jgi:transposase
MKVPRVRAGCGEALPCSVRTVTAGEVGVMAEKRQRYDAEFREGAVRIVTETGKTIAEVAKDLGIKETTLGSWVARARKTGGDGTLGESECEELLRLRRKRVPGPIRKTWPHNQRLYATRELTDVAAYASCRATASCAAEESREPARVRKPCSSGPYCLASSALCASTSSSLAAVISRNARRSSVGG